MKPRYSIFSALVVVVLACVGTGCGSKPQAAADSATLIVSLGAAEPKSLFPGGSNEEFSSAVLRALFSPLVEWDAQLQPQEVAAESITSPDNKVWTIKLKAGWKFHNGEPVTADSYINAWNAGAYGPNIQDSSYFFTKIQGYEDLNPVDAKQPPKAKKLKGLVKVDDLTFQVTLKDPYVNFKSMLGYTVFFPLPTAAFLDIPENKLNRDFEQAPIGQGPFRMQGKWEHDQVIHLLRYEEYAGPEKPQIGGIDFRIYQTQTTQYQDLLAGQLDIVPQLPPEAIAGAPADLGARFLQNTGSTIQVLAFPTFDRHFAKVEMRRAISMAIDRDEITRTIFANAQVPLRGFVAPFVPGARADVCGEYCQYNPQRAKQLFEAAGGKAAVGGRIEIAYNVDGGHRPWVDATCNQIRAALDVECVGNPQPKFADMLRKARAKEPMGMFRMGWIADYPVLENYLDPLFGTNGSSNYYGYSNAEFDRLMAAGDRAETPAAALALYQQAEDIVARDLPVIPVRYMQNTYGISTRVAHVELDPFRRVRWMKVTAAGH
jgi:ABC-type oligopeptide transport system substrate-binding subunit